MAINVSVQHNGGLLPGKYIVDPWLLPSGNLLKCHEEVLSLQPTKQHIRFDGTIIVLRILLLSYLIMYYNVVYVLFLSGIPAWRLM